MIVDRCGKLVCEVRSLSEASAARLDHWLYRYEISMARGDRKEAALAEKKITRILDEINSRL